MTARTLSRHLGATVLAAIVAACAPMPTPAPQPVAPQITEETLRARAKERLEAGTRLYETGDYEGAQKSLGAALDHGLLSRAEQGTVRKHLAFMHCMAGREAPCRDEFRKAFEIDPSFALTAAEDGHPVWGPVYRNVRAQLIAERDATREPPRVPLGKAEQQLADGLVKYHAGDFTEALRLFEAATKEGLREKADQVNALKHAAFSQCLLGRQPPCRATFLRLLEADPSFDLSPAEAGHPSWARVFAGAKAQAKRAPAERVARPAVPAAAPAPAPKASP